MTDRDWKDELIEEANAAGRRASYDEPDSVILADARNCLVPGGPADRLATNLADDLEAKAQAPLTRAMCATLARAAANCQGMTLLGLTSSEILTILGAAAAKLEMRAKP